jgi:hypothetical protein
MRLCGLVRLMQLRLTRGLPRCSVCLVTPWGEEKLIVGVYIPGDHPSASSIPLDPATMYPLVDMGEEPNWPGLFTDFDFTSFFNMPTEGFG